MPYEILDNRNNDNLEKGLFASLSAIQANQFGREIFSTVIKFKDLAEFLEIFPEVQRDIIPRKVASIRNYILSSNTENLRFFSSITVSCKGTAFYDKQNKRLALDVANTKLSINDGQHRTEAIRTALLRLEQDFSKSKDKDKTTRIREQIDALEEMAIPMVIFNGLNESQEKQLFHDLNSLAQRPSKNANIKLSQTDYFARLARELADYNRYLKHYGVEKEKGSIHKNNPNTILLTSLYKSLKILYKQDDIFDENSYQKCFEEANSWLNDVLGVLPSDLNSKGKYVLEKSYGLTSIFKFVSAMIKEEKSREFIVGVIAGIDYDIHNKEWETYGGKISSFGNIEFTGGTNGGFRAIFNLLMDKSNTIE